MPHVLTPSPWELGIQHMNRGWGTNIQTIATSLPCIRYAHTAEFWPMRCEQKWHAQFSSPAYEIVPCMIFLALNSLLARGQCQGWLWKEHTKLKMAVPLLVWVLQWLHGLHGADCHSPTSLLIKNSHTGLLHETGVNFYCVSPEIWRFIYNWSLHYPNKYKQHLWECLSWDEGHTFPLVNHLAQKSKTSSRPIRQLWNIQGTANSQTTQNHHRDRFSPKILIWRIY